MKKNLYFRSVYKSTAALEDAVVGVILRALAFPRTLLEVFIRKNLGERYFSMSIAIMLVLVLAYVPIGLLPYLKAISLLGESAASSVGQFNSMTDLNTLIEQQQFQHGGRRFDWGDFFLHELSWYFFLGAFFYMCLQRQKEIKRLPSVFEMGRSSFDPGEIHPRFWTVEWKNRKTDLRMIETVLEPLFFFLIGLGLIFLQQTVGYLIVLSSFGYWLNYRLAYYQGDHFIMDTIDEMIFSEEKATAFILDKDPKDTRGVRYYGRKPADPNTRRKLAETFEEEEMVEVN